MRGGVFCEALSRFVDVPSAICQQSCAQAKVTGDEHVQQQATVDAGFIGSRELVEDDICVLFFHLLLGSFPRSPTSTSKRTSPTRMHSCLVLRSKPVDGKPLIKGVGESLAVAGLKAG